MNLKVDGGVEPIAPALGFAAKKFCRKMSPQPRALPIRWGEGEDWWAVGEIVISMRVFRNGGVAGEFVFNEKRGVSAQQKFREWIGILNEAVKGGGGEVEMELAAIAEDSQ